MGRTSPLSLLAAVAVFALLAAGCQRVANPQGWAPPKLDGDTLYVSIERGKIAALDPSPEAGADCENAEDDDGDGGVNEGCPAVGAKSESGDDCRNASNDDESGLADNDNSVNDGCPPFYALWVFPPNTDEGDRLDLEGIYGAPIRDGDFVYFAAYDGNVYALNAEDGIPIWAVETDDAIVSSLALSDGTLFVASTDGRLYAINAASGDEIDRFDTGSSIWASPLVAEDVIYVATMDGDLYALDKQTLDRVTGFSFKTKAGLVMDPTLADGDKLLVGGIDSKLYALDPTTGEEIWPKPFEGGNWFWGSPRVEGETVYIGDLDGNVYALDLSEGTERWRFKAAEPVRAAPLLAGGALLIVDREGNAYGLSPEDGQQVWASIPLGKTVLSDPYPFESAAASSPAAGDDDGVEVLISAQGGDLCRIDTATVSQDEPDSASPGASPAGASPPRLCVEIPSP